MSEITVTYFTTFGIASVELPVLGGSLVLLPPVMLFDIGLEEQISFTRLWSNFVDGDNMNELLGIILL